MKCALFPLHFWLPAAHGTPGAPTAVSAILSASISKAVFTLFIRLQAVFSPVFDMDVFFFFLGRGRHRAGGYHGGLSVRYQADPGPTPSQGGPESSGLSPPSNPVSRFGAISCAYYHQPCIIKSPCFSWLLASHHRLRHPERL